MPALDLRKQFKHLYNPPSKQPQVVDVPVLQFAMIDGFIEPGATPDTSPAFANAMEALYGISYTLKFMSKLDRENPIDYPVMALEGLWWVGAGEFSFDNKDNWCWTVMILQPEHITQVLFDAAREQLRQRLRKKQHILDAFGDNPALDLLRLETFHEGRCVQIMHIGPFAEEPATVARLHAFALDNGYRLHGKHHEIYLGDPRRAAPDKLKTILRHPIE